MRRSLPPLNAVRAFEAAARHESFAQAADELAVTPSAVSQQVKMLEDILGCALFTRHARGLSLTAAGRRYLPALSEALDLIADASRTAAAGTDDRTLSVTCLGSFGALWLVPRLVDFEAAVPDIDVRLSTSDKIVDLGRDGIDAGVRYGPGPYPGIHAEPLMEETVFPVCAPAMAKRLTRLEDLANVPLLHDASAGARATYSWQSWLRRWPAWLNAHDIKGFDASRGPGFTNSTFLVQAAIAERGVMLGRSVLVHDALCAGTLVRPFDMTLPAGARYWFVTTADGLTQRKVARFREWLFDAVARM
ncbi:transcriptional regulator GcvA [Marivibrio halodurans]|uniref:transcriptional regulator GcvA n=1 Tax=Marivibrio halodurans TaxID=2039722 RepID=UPI0024847BFF|nr:transcriptional regulator GcvA [Marivibrio halodurans]